jgi:protein SCO1/2
MSRERSVLTTAVVAIVAIAAGMLLARAIFDRSSTTDLGLAKATLLAPPRPLPEFALTDQAGVPFDPARLKGHWTLMFFGFTHCPDVCPTTLGMLAQVEKKLNAALPAASPQVVLVSVDPERDTPAQLKSYVKFFSPTFTGVTGSVEAVDNFTRALGVPVAKTQLADGNYTVDHSAAIFLLDPQGAMRALFSTPHSADLIAADYRRIVRAQ